jgi:predicted dehydrogenase
MRSEPPRVAIVGAGLMGRWHAAAARRAGAHVVAIIDADVARAAQLARRFAAAHGASLQALQGAQPTVAHLCTPASSHPALAQQAFDLGLHLVCEKPLADDAAAVRAMHRGAHAARRRLLAVHQYTMQHGMRAARDAQAHAGALLRACFEFHSAGAERIAAPDAGDALIAEVMPHPLSVLAALQPDRPLSGVEWSALAPRPGECEVIGLWGSTVVTIGVSAHARPTRARATLAFETVTVELDFFHGYATVARGRASRIDKALRPFTESLARLGAASANALQRGVQWEPAYPGLRALLAQFYASLQAGADTQPSDAAAAIDLYDARDRIAAALQRARGGRA